MQETSFYRAALLLVLLLFATTSAQAQPAAPAFTIASEALARSMPAEAQAALARAAERPTTRKVHVIAFGDLTRFAERTHATIPLPSGKAFVARATRFDQHAGGFTWAGRSEDGVESAFFTATGGSVYGMVHVQGRTYSVEPAAKGRHLLVEVDTDAFGPDEPEGFE
jgi:hypothetical protein